MIAKEKVWKNIIFSVPIKKKCDDGKKITYKLKFVDSFRFMLTSLSNLVDNSSEINKEECKACMNGEISKSECDFIWYENRIYVSNVKNAIEYGENLHDWVLLIAHLKLTKKNAKYAWKEKILNQSVILWELKIIN